MNGNISNKTWFCQERNEKLGTKTSLKDQTKQFYEGWLLLPWTKLPEILLLKILKMLFLVLKEDNY